LRWILPFENNIRETQGITYGNPFGIHRLQKAFDKVNRNKLIEIL
jgi:hypothetical protein